MLKYLRMGSKRTKAIWWVLVVVVVFTFVGGFIFMFGAGMDSSMRAKASGALGTVNGSPITRAEYQNAVNEQRQAYRQRSNAEPSDQESRMIEAQAWRALISQRLLDQRAKQLGLTAHDKEVVLNLQAAPPNVLISAPDFQTNGKFDPNKYGAALRNPNINWAPFEQLVREQLPVRKLQERMIASIKLSQPELEQAYRERFERVAVTVVAVPPMTTAPVRPPAQADLDRIYAQKKGLFAAPERTRLELLSTPKKFSEEELRAAREQAQSLVDRARRGEDFAQLAKDYSEGPGAQQGGEIQRIFQPADLGPEIGPKLAALQKGQIADPIAEPGHFVVIKVLDRTQDPGAPGPKLRLAQIVINVRPGEQTLKDQLDEMRKLRDRAKRIGLAKAATEKGLTTTRTSFFPFGGTPPQLYEAPEIADWAFSAKVGELSSVVETTQEFLIGQVTDHRAAGPAPKEDVMEQLRQLAEAEARVQAARPKVDEVMGAVAQGRSLEDAAKAAGLEAIKVPGMSRTQPDPRLSASPEAVGAVFASPVGKVVGPFDTPGGWLIARLDGRLPADTTAYNQIKGQVTSDILSRKQNDFMQSWIAEERRHAKIEDLRTP
jgi:parvulin-like peptidyl-prolyl isomerase